MSKLNKIKVDFSELKLYGRSKEVETLRRVHEQVQVSEPGCKRRVILVEGRSGSGKSFLVREALKQQAFEVGGFFASGKSDATRPFNAFSDALSQLWFECLERCNSEGLRETFAGMDFEALTGVLPELQKELSGDSQYSSRREVVDTTAHASESQDFAFKRMLSAIKDFLHRLSSTEKSVVLFIDGLHRQDQANLNIFHAIAVDSEMTGLVLVGSFRSEETTEHLEDLTRALEKEVTLTRLSLGYFSIRQIFDVLVDLSQLRMDDRVGELAVLIHQKTEGNPMFAFQYLRLLLDEMYIKLDLDTFQWDWDIDKIRVETNVSENVVGFIIVKIHRQSQITQTILHTGACIGFKFGALLVTKAFSQIQGEDIGLDRVLSHLEEAEKEGLVERTGENSTKFVFTHDKVHEAAYKLDVDGQKRVHLILGKTIRRANSATKQSMFLIATDQLNKGSSLIEDREEKMNLVEMNLKSGAVAYDQAAYFLAIDHLEHGIKLLGDEERRWKDSFDFALKLNKLLCKVHYCVGSFDRCYELVDEVHRNTQDFYHELPLLCTQMEAFGSEGRNDEAVETAVELLSRLGEKLQKRISKVTVLIELIKTGRVVGSKSLEKLAALPELENERIRSILDIMNQMISYAVTTSNDNLLAVIFLRMVRYSVIHGLYLPNVFAGYGVVLCALGKYSAAYTYGQLSCRLLENRSVPKQQLCLAQLPYFFLTHLQEPLPKTIDHMSRAYRIGMRTAGDPKHAFAAAAGELYAHFQCGFPLSTLVDDGRKYISQAAEFGQTDIEMVIAALIQVALNLTTFRLEQACLDGDWFVEEEFLEKAEAHVQSYLWAGKLVLATFYHIDSVAFEMCQIFRKIPLEKDGPLAFKFFRIFCMGVTSFRFARATGERKHIRLARKCLRYLDKIVQQGGTNVHPTVLIIVAERAWQQQRSHVEVKAAFEKAIQTSQRCGFQHLAALANESLGVYMLEQEDMGEAGHYLRIAREIFAEWGAISKVDELETDHRQVLCAGTPTRQGRRSSSYMSGRSRFDKNFLRMRKSKDPTKLNGSAEDVSVRSKDKNFLSKWKNKHNGTLNGSDDLSVKNKVPRTLISLFDHTECFRDCR